MSNRKSYSKISRLLRSKHKLPDFDTVSVSSKGLSIISDTYSSRSKISSKSKRSSKSKISSKSKKSSRSTVISKLKSQSKKSKDRKKLDSNFLSRMTDEEINGNPGFASTQEQKTKDLFRSNSENGDIKEINLNPQPEPESEPPPVPEKKEFKKPKIYSDEEISSILKGTVEVKIINSLRKGDQICYFTIDKDGDKGIRPGGVITEFIKPKGFFKNSSARLQIENVYGFKWYVYWDKIECYKYDDLAILSEENIKIKQDIKKIKMKYKEQNETIQELKDLVNGFIKSHP